MRESKCERDRERKEGTKGGAGEVGLTVVAYFLFWANTKTRSHAKVTSENIFAKKNFDEF